MACRVLAFGLVELGDAAGTIAAWCVADPPSSLIDAALDVPHVVAVIPSDVPGIEAFGDADAAVAPNGARRMRDRWLDRRSRRHVTAGGNETAGQGLAFGQVPVRVLLVVTPCAMNASCTIDLY
jgi:hypothetical protein